MHQLTFQRYRFTVETTEPISLPFYKGGTLRGGFGTTFRRIVCALRRQDCDDCMLASNCVYAYVFETSPPSQGPDDATEPRHPGGLASINRYEKIPHPFIIEPPPDPTRVYAAGEPMAFRLVLVGRAIDYLPYFVYTFEELGKAGLGKGRGKYVLKTLHAEFSGRTSSTDPALLPDREETVYSNKDGMLKAGGRAALDIPSALDLDANGAGTLAVRFVTPLRLRYERHLAADIPFHVLVRSLLRRLQLLSYYHCDQQTIPWDASSIVAESMKVETERNDLSWWDWERYSSRQKTKLKMGGVIGKVLYRGPVAPFLPLLRAGEILHVGKGTSFGFGKYEVKRGG